MAATDENTKTSHLLGRRFYTDPSLDPVTRSEAPFDRHVEAVKAAHVLGIFVDVLATHFRELISKKPRSSKLPKEQEEYWRQSLPRPILEAIVYPDEGGAASNRLHDYPEHLRRMETSAKYFDRQSELPPRTPAPLTSITNGGGVEEREPGEIVQDETIQLSQRIEALQQWVFLDNDAAADFILEELQKDNLPAEWRNALIYAAEDARFPDEEDQFRLCKRLRELALYLREHPEPNIERVVWCAVRRFASLIPAECAFDLMDFLHQKGQVDTRLVALQGVVRIFEMTPAESLVKLQPLSDRVFELTSKLIDPDIITAGETSAIAEAGIHALAALDDPRLEDCLTRLDSLGWEWLSRQVRADLTEVRRGWESRVPDIASHHAYLQLSHVLDERKQASHEPAAE